MSVERYLHQSLGACGFAVLNADVAMRLRPDLWPGDGLECAGEFARAFKRNQFSSMPHALRLTALLVGIDRPVPVLTRSAKRLAERIEEVTGYPVERIVEGEQIEVKESPRRVKWQEMQQRHQQAQKSPAAPMTPRNERAVPDDVQGLDIAAKEPPRFCTACDNRTGDGGCLPAIRGEFPGRPAHFKPTADHPRRCLHYVPGTEFSTGERRDLRTGQELWPELLSAKAPAAPTTAAQKLEPAGMIERAKAIVADMLKAGARPAAEIIAAGQGASISERTIQRAAEQMGVAKAKDGNGGWRWALTEGARAVA